MKKVLALVLSCLMLVVALAGCGSSSNDKKDGLETVTEGKLTMATNATFLHMNIMKARKLLVLMLKLQVKSQRNLILNLKLLILNLTQLYPVYRVANTIWVWQV